MNWRVRAASMAALLLCLAAPASAQSPATQAEWQKAVSQKILRGIRLPAATREMSSPVVLKVRIAILRDGAIDTVELVESSGSDAVDEATLGMIRRNGTLLPFSADMAEDRKDLTLPIRFHFNGDAPPGFPATRTR
ncbi:hypothetical protein LMG26690_02474 [Achromobacter animicus]|uniref:TonB C-terminal domain-containing protein n=1 Tax=Achromobacter animicus TaxID=1389935 RepID=A0A6S6ZZE8_9BURK|nr:MULTISPECIES: TonB family protein [Achromobacter]CAB3698165.1 hypothetical protein LMG26690_02474 [Achromobacter animicus]